MFTLSLQKTISIASLLVCLTSMPYAATAQQFGLQQKQTIEQLQRHHNLSPAFSTRKNDNSEITAHCWTISQCNQMISDCISVGGQFRTGITDHKTGATSEGSCTL